MRRRRYVPQFHDSEPVEVKFNLAFGLRTNSYFTFGIQVCRVMKIFLAVASKLEQTHNSINFKRTNLLK